jgi:hypothetical protein
MENYNTVAEMKEEKRTEFKTYYERPTQVMFYEADPNTWSWGIAYRDDIICACCGAVLHITEIIDDFNDYAKENNAKVSKPIYEYNGWCDIVDGIYGGELPSGLAENDNGEYVEDEIDEAESDESDNDM